MSKQRDLFYKTLVIGVIVLFIGLGIQPAFAVTLDTFDFEDDCEICPKLSKQHIVRIKSLLDRLEKYDNELSVLSKLNPENEEKYQELSNIHSRLKEMNKELDYNIWIPPICFILFPIFMFLFLLFSIEIGFAVWIDSLQIPIIPLILGDILIGIGGIMFLLVFIFAEMMIGIGCIP